MLDDTHDPAVTSWVESANAPGADFPVQNLPFGWFRRRGDTPSAAKAAPPHPEIGVAIGDRILPLAACGSSPASMNELMAEPADAQRRRRLALHRLLRADAGPATRARLAAQLVPMAEAELLVPAAIGDYTDFFSSIHHATNASSLVRPGQPLFPNYRHLPLAYHGRSSSIVASGTDIRRPAGQQRRLRQGFGAQGREGGPIYALTRRLDYEAELGLFVGPGNAMGNPIPIDQAWEHLFGVCLLNDWSARDIQAWEADPLGPFLSKSFATSVSPWVVTAAALEPFRAAAAPRGAGDPPLVDNLSSPGDRATGALRIEVEVWLATAAMRRDGVAPVRLSSSDAAALYWTPAQLVAHHTSNGCNLRPGDLLGSGTLSGPVRESWGCLLELTRGGRELLSLPNGETRGFLEDGDEVTLRGRCTAPGARSIGFGDCRGRVRAA